MARMVMAQAITIGLLRQWRAQTSIISDKKRRRPWHLEGHALASYLPFFSSYFQNAELDLRQYRDGRRDYQSDNEQDNEENLQLQRLTHHQMEARRRPGPQRTTDRHHQRRQRPQGNQDQVRRS